MHSLIGDSGGFYRKNEPKPVLLMIMSLASTPPGMPGTHPPIFWLWERQREYPPEILLRTFGYSRPILVALRSLSLKPTPQIRFSQAGGQSAHEARPPNLELALTPLDNVIASITASHLRCHIVTVPVGRDATAACRRRRRVV